MDTVPKRVFDYIRKEAAPICDDCITDELALTNRNQASQATSAFGVTPLFSRYYGMCALCGRGKMVIENA
jgi:hypothetical protein